MFQNKVLSRIFVPYKEEAIEGLRKIHNDKLYNLQLLPDIIRVIKLGKYR
jgi:hypothetical protein